jgi:hypothetical protein
MLVLIGRGPPTPLRRVAPDAPRELLPICEKAMAWRLEERYASVEELARDLDAFLEGRVMGARRGGFWSEAKERLLRRQRPRHPDTGEPRHPDAGEPRQPDAGEPRHPDTGEPRQPDAGEKGS